MKQNILALIDYKNSFGSKWNATSYRGGMDKELLKLYFEKYGLSIDFKQFSDIDFNISYPENTIVIYTSSEDIGFHYKDYIEDIVLGLKEKGLTIVPDFKFLRANNNKVFMEMLKGIIFDEKINNLSAQYKGVLEEIGNETIKFPIVIKEAAGAMSYGVSLANNKKELTKVLKKIARTPNIKNDLKDILRSYKHKSYIKESLYRKKFVLQQFIPNLKSDYKILIFGKRYYIFERPVRKNDFRASGSGNINYIYGSKVSCPKGIFDFAKDIFIQANVPHLSIDVAYDNQQFYLLEFQAIYFGTVGHVKSDGYYVNENNSWVIIKEKLEIEKVYADSIIAFLHQTIK